MSTDEAWENWGKNDPYYGVLSDDKFRNDSLSNNTKKEFFESGVTHISHVLSLIKLHFPSVNLQSGIDFGCGTGRLALPLAKVLKRVIGIDVSESMLAEAKKNCESNNVNNVELIKSDDELSLLTGNVDFVHSYIVFQHIPTKRGEKIISQLLQHLAPNGVAVLHMTYGKGTDPLRKVIDTLRYNVPLVQNIINVARGRKFSEPPMQMNSYNLNNVIKLFQDNGMSTAYCEFTDHAKYLGITFYAKKD